MTRATCSVARHKKRKKLMKRAKGFWGDRKNHIRQTLDAVMKAMGYAFEHRKQKKREFRKLWIERINVAARIHGLSYSKLIDGLNKANIEVNRKVLADLALNDMEAFKALAESAKGALKASQ